MGEGELSAAFRALARDAAEAMERAADRMAATSESTAAKAEAGGKDLADTDAAAGRRFDDLRSGESIHGLVAGTGLVTLRRVARVGRSGRG